MRNLFLVVLLLFSLKSIGQDDQLKTDWANKKKYKEKNKQMQPSPKGKKRIVFMGDSITELWEMLDSSFFSDNNYVCRGISGQTTSQMLVRFRQDVIDLHPSAVVILAGTNDIAGNTGPISIEEIFGNIVSMAELAKANHIKVLLCSVLPAYDYPWHTGLQPAEKIVQLNDLIKTYCSKNAITYVDYFSKMADEKKGLDNKFTKDGVHPTLDGYKVMEPIITKSIHEALIKKSTTVTN